jgi:hypothetical protein
MSHKCHEGHCHTHDEDSSHHHGECSCCCHKSHEEECNFPEQLIQLADDAWMCVLKEKIKEQIKSKSGKQLDDLAKLVNDANHKRWHDKLAEKHDCDDFKQQLSAFFHKKP